MLEFYMFDSRIMIIIMIIMIQWCPGGYTKPHNRACGAQRCGSIESSDSGKTIEL